MNSQQDVSTGYLQILKLCVILILVFFCVILVSIVSLYDLCNNTQYEKLFIFTNEVFT